MRHGVRIEAARVRCKSLMQVTDEEETAMDLCFNHLQEMVSRLTSGKKVDHWIF